MAATGAAHPPLPVPLTSLVGREDDLASLRHLLRSAGPRLVTLTGTGGSGKTRLAQQLALDLYDEFAEGARFISLAGVREPELVPQTLALELGVRAGAAESLDDALARYLHPREMLIVLDNFEQVSDAAPSVARLLSACPSITIVVTSRSPLRVQGEQEFPVPPLALPGTRRSQVRDLTDIPSIELFVQRAQAVDPSFVLDERNARAVADICLRLDGLPLAIELAAARVKVLAPDELLGRLSSRLRVLIGGARDQPARLQTMRSAIDWSYELLSEDEQALFRHVSVFAGGFTLEAAEAIVPGDETLDLLASLVDKSLVQQFTSPTRRRFTMLETIREYGLEHLVRHNQDADTRRRHANWFQELARQTTSADLRRPLPEAVRQNAVEHDNFRSALSWLREHDPSSALQLTVWLCPYWYAQGLLREARQWLETTLAAGEDAALDLRARALFTLAKLKSEAGEYDHGGAIDMLESSLALFTAAGDDNFVARCLASLALAEEKAGHDDRALARYEQALERYTALNDPVGVVNALVNLGDTAWRQGDLDRSERYCREALDHWAASFDPYDTSMIRSNLAQIELSRGNILHARQQFLLALESALGIDYRIGMVDTVAGMAGVAQAAGQSELAARWLGVVEACCANIGIAVVPHHGLWRRTLAATRANLSVDAFESARQSGMTLPLEDVVAEIQAWSLPDPAQAPNTSASGSVPLSPREQEVLQLLVAGQTDRQIAEALFISHRTAQYHVANIFNKLGVNSRTAAATTAIGAGLVRVPASTE